MIISNRSNGFRALTKKVKISLLSFFLNFLYVLLYDFHDKQVDGVRALGLSQNEVGRQSGSRP